jgi:hypothetical protein
MGRYRTTDVLLIGGIIGLGVAILLAVITH